MSYFTNFIFLLLLFNIGFARYCSSIHDDIKLSLNRVLNGHVEIENGLAVPLFAPNRKDGNTLELCDEGIDYLKKMKTIQLAFISVFGNARYYC